jgi:hypothetical protein
VISFKVDYGSANTKMLRLNENSDMIDPTFGPKAAAFARGLPTFERMQRGYGMPLLERRNEACRRINEETIELHAMGRLNDNSVRQHLDTCDFCRERVAEHRSWIEDLKWTLRTFQQAKQVDSNRGDADRGSRPNDS